MPQTLASKEFIQSSHLKIYILVEYNNALEEDRQRREFERTAKLQQDDLEALNSRKIVKIADRRAELVKVVTESTECSNNEKDIDLSRF
jgi:hypothetical protein